MSSHPDFGLVRVTPGSPLPFDTTTLASRKGSWGIRNSTSSSPQTITSRTMTTSAPLQGLLGGVSLAIPVFALLTNSGNVFGISGFMHRVLSTSPKTYAWWEGLAGVLGLVGGGAFVGVLQRGVSVQSVVMAPLLLPGGTFVRAVLSGFLAGLGSKVSFCRNGQFQL